MEKQHTELPAVTLPNGDSVVMLQADVGTRGVPNWEEWDTCRTCGFSYPKSEIEYVNGTPYCVRLQHGRDVPGTGGIKEA
jgi:hypothetical protein